MELEQVLAELTALVDGLARTEGTTPTAIPDLAVHRVSQPSIFEKERTYGPSVSVVVQGSKVSTHRGETFSYDRTKVLVVTGEADFVGDIVEAHPFLALCFPLPADVVAELLLSLPAVAAAPPPTDDPLPAFVTPLDLAIAQCLLRLFQAERDPLEREHVAPLVVRELVFRLLRSDAAAGLRRAVSRTDDAVKIGAAMRFVRDNVGRSLSVEEIARHVAMSPSHFAHRFRAVARMSPMRYVRQLRLQHARRWMIADGLRVNEAATRAGYESTSHFTRDFKSEYGSAPGEYARRFRATESRIMDFGTSTADQDIASCRAHA